MTDINVDKIAAAIFAAAKCSREASGDEAYLDAYEKFIGLMAERRRAKRGSVKVSDAALTNLRAPRKRAP